MIGGIAAVSDSTLQPTDNSPTESLICCGAKRGILSGPRTMAECEFTKLYKAVCQSARRTLETEVLSLATAESFQRRVGMGLTQQHNEKARHLLSWPRRFSSSAVHAE
jgi:hypothetical protein